MHDSVSLSRKPSRTLGEDGDDNIGDFDDPDASTKTVQVRPTALHLYVDVTRVSTVERTERSPFI